MKKLIFYIYLLFIISLCFAEVEYTWVEMETLFEFSNGNKDFQLGRTLPVEGSSDNSCLDLIITEKSYIIGDSWNRRIVEVSRDYKEFHEYKGSLLQGTYGFLVKDGSQIYNFDMASSSVSIYDANDEKWAFRLRDLVSNPMYFLKNGVRYYGFSPLENCLIGEKEDGTYLLLDLKNTNKQSILKGDEALQYLSETSEDIKVEENQYIIYQGTLHTRNPRTYYNYWKDKTHDLNYDLAYLENKRFFKTYYSGQDKYGNTYWSDITAVFIFDSRGKLIVIPVIPGKNARLTNMPKFSIDSEGNLYKIIQDEQKGYLKTVRKFW